MNKIVLTLVTVLLLMVGSVSFTGCGGEAPQEEATHQHDEDNHDHAAVYQCPMQCEGDKTYAEAGKCPSCGMALEEVGDHGHDHDDGHSHDHGEGGHEH